MSDILLPTRVAAAFGVERSATQLAGTEGRTYRSGNVVLRRESGESELQWSAGVLQRLPEEGFRIERPLLAIDGSWSVDGWSAWTFLDGRSATPADAPAVAQAVRALHHSLASIPYAPHLTDQAGFADPIAWGDNALPATLPPAIEAAVRNLVELRRPVPEVRNQVIHGDLNFHNILIADGEVPGFIDFTPYWRPPEFASAIAAFWLGPYLGNTRVLSDFDRVQRLDQMLIRVALRQLLRLIEMDKLKWADEYVRAADVVQRWMR